MREKLFLLLLMVNLVVGDLSAGGQKTGAAPAGADFSVKAFHLDLRIQVMTMPALKAFAQKIRGQGINTLIMEYEATYPYEHHPLIPGKYAYSKAEIVSFIAFCNKLGLDVIPLQQSFGHVEYILRHYHYKGLREDDEDLSQVCPLEAVSDSLLFTELYTELVSTHTSPYIHIGGDETHLLGHCAKCRLKAEKEGISRLYIDYINMLCRIVVRLGKRPVLWADIALKYPEALQSLPKGTIFVDWNYGWDLDRFGEHEKLLNSGYEIWGAPALRSSPDNYYLTQWEKHFNNIRDFVPKAREMGYKGMVMTSWSTSGVYSYLYESENSLIDLYAVRHVYPITGFNMLLAAYVKSIYSNEALQVEDFIVDYSRHQYGFNRAQAMDFWQALRAAPYAVDEGVVKSPHPLTLTGLTDSVTIAARVLHALKPLTNKEEFEHYRLMTDIRLQYLRFLCIEQQVNAPTFTRAALPSIRQKLRVLLDKNTQLSQRFINLNKGSYHLLELQEENRLRARKLQVLYDHLRH